MKKTRPNGVFHFHVFVKPLDEKERCEFINTCCRNSHLFWKDWKYWTTAFWCVHFYACFHPSQSSGPRVSGDGP